MAIMRRSPYSPFSDMSRMLDRMWSLMEIPAAPLDGESLQPQNVNMLAVDMTSDENNILVQTRLPGFKDDEVKVEVHGNVLTIEAESKSEREEERANWHIREIAYGKYARSVTLPEEVNSDKAEASLENGILTIKLPKSQSSPAQKIAVKAKKLLTDAKKVES
jgi:HSP20 family protein